MNEIAFRVVDDSLTDTQLDDALHQLLDDLLELHLDATRLRTGQPPVGAEKVEVGMVVVQAVTEADVANQVAERVRAWFARTGVQQVAISVGDTSLALTQGTDDQQERLVTHFTGVTAR
ncbi:MAG TPA: hypothetical protein VNO31_52235 [Umezawaea sp.]|nr:hypothetical protein [Umezawaea sp.]